MKTFNPNRRNKQLLFSLLFSFFAFSMQSESQVNFQNIDLDQASLLGKKILVSFSADWCLPCKIMDESIFSDQEIATLINENFTAIKTDVDSEEGNVWNDLYHTNYLPATLFAFENGNEIERLSGVPSRDEFLKLLHEILAKNEPEVKKEAAVIVSVKESRVVLETTGITIQLGAFSSINNAKRLIGEIESKDHYNHSIVEEYSSSDKLLYKVVLVGFYTESEAIKSLVLVQRQGFDGFIKKP